MGSCRRVLGKCWLPAEEGTSSTKGLMDLSCSQNLVYGLGAVSLDREDVSCLLPASENITDKSLPLALPTPCRPCRRES